MWTIKRVAFVLPCVWLTLWGSSAGDQGTGALKLNLDQCVAMALEANVSVLRAGYDLDQSRNRVVASVSDVLPAVGLRSTKSKRQNPVQAIVGDRVIESDETVSASLSVSEVITVGSIAGILESVADRNSTAQEVRSVRHEVAYLAKQKYLAVLRAERLLVVRQEALDLSKKRMEKAQAMLDVGSGVRSDVLRAQVEVSRNELELISAGNALRIAEAELRHFLAVDDDRSLELADVPETEELPYTLESALTEAMDVSPDVRARGYAVEARRSGVWRERSGWFPAFQFSWSKDYAGFEFPGKTADLWDEAEWRWQISTSVNLFDGLYTFGRVRSAKAVLKSAREDFSQSRRDVALEVRQALYNVEEARQRVKVSGQTVSLAEEELRLAEERYRLGGGTMLEQIDAQVALSEARTSNIEALYDYLLSQAQLAKAVGKD